MLGIRRFRGKSFDLWCGPRSDFVCDIWIEDIQPGLEKARLSSSRHGAILMDGVFDVSALIKEAVSVVLEKSPCPERLTFVTSQVEDYKRCQAALFALIPEDDEA